MMNLNWMILILFLGPILQYVYAEYFDGKQNIQNIEDALDEYENFDDE